MKKVSTYINMSSAGKTGYNKDLIHLSWCYQGWWRPDMPLFLLMIPFMISIYVRACVSLFFCIFSAYKIIDLLWLIGSNVDVSGLLWLFSLITAAIQIKGWCRYIIFNRERIACITISIPIPSQNNNVVQINDYYVIYVGCTGFLIFDCPYILLDIKID